MYGSYGSYSSMGATAPIDISSSRNTHRSDYSSSCAFPSWPQRMSLSPGARDDDDYHNRATSYISDDELLYAQVPGSRDDDALSIGSGSSFASPVSPRGCRGRVGDVDDEEAAELARRRDEERAQYVQAMFEAQKQQRQQERRRQQQLLQKQQQMQQQAKPRRPSSGSKRTSSRGSKPGNMAPIKESSF